MKFFDKAYCIHCNTHINRLQELKEEFERVGLNVDILYVNGCENNPDPVLDCSLNHVKIIKKAYDEGLNHILIMENDIRFLKDISILEEYINNIPDDYDIILLDYIYGYFPYEINRLSKKDKSKHFINIGFDNNVWSAGCYLLSRKGMEHIIYNQSKNLKQPDYDTTYKKLDVEDNLVRYIPRINLSVQKVFENNLRFKVHNEDNTKYRYELQGVNLNDYNI
jgi:GR25 family glycosyltransferase involved in LPS biosynthesis